MVNTPLLGQHLNNWTLNTGYQTASYKNHSLHDTLTYLIFMTNIGQRIFNNNNNIILLSV